MPFNSFEFGIFFVVVFVAFAASPTRRRVPVLLGASLVFYGLFRPSYLVLLLATLAVNFILLRCMAKSGKAQGYLIASIVFTLSVLGVFKYAAFALSLASPFLRAFHPESRLPDLVLPLGISFYSFECISVSVDVYRGRLICPTFARYVTFVTFFPHLIAGPIMRGNELFPQLELGGERTRGRTRRGVWLFAVGLAKKVILADFLLQPFVNEVFHAAGATNGPSHLVAAYSFAFQIYFDFSGYTDMARGIACVLGFELPMNFEEPYLSRNPSEFWRRWHMTLSRWLRDYLYVPLGGSRKGALRVHVNVIVTMVLGGLWHGAGLNFVVWGGLHGLLLSLYRLRGSAKADPGELRWSDLPKVLLLFHVVCWLWVPFRTSTWADTLVFWRAILGRGYGEGWPLVPLVIVVLCAALHVAERHFRTRLPAIHRTVDAAAWGPMLEGGLLGAVLSASLLASGAGVEFIYFQF